MPSNNNGFTLEENLVLSNEELTSNISKLASFIRSFEKGTWEAARDKARILLKTKKAFEYIDQVRAIVSGKEPPKTESTPTPPAKVTKPINRQTIYEKNYNRLMAIAPGLEDKLENFNGDYFYGKSSKTGYMDFNLELIDEDEKGFYLAISHYYKQNGDMVPDPDMEIFVDINKKTVEALHFQDAYHYVEVYPDKRNRDLFSKNQKKEQNEFLAFWLKNLKDQGHKIEWRKSDTTGISPNLSPEPPSDSSDSIIVDTFKKADDSKRSTHLKVEKSEKKEEPKTKEEEHKEEPKKEEAPIVSMHNSSIEQQVKSLEKFVRIVAFIENGDHVNTVSDLTDRVKHIAEHQGTTDYMVKAWLELQKEDHLKTKKLNFYLFYSLLPEIVNDLINGVESVRLVSEKTKEAFRVVLGDDRNKKSLILGIYQMTGKSNEPTILIHLDQTKKLLTVVTVTNGFFDLPTFSDTMETATGLEPYQVTLGCEKWLEFLIENDFKPLEVDLKKVDEKKAESIQTEEPEDELDNDYINKDIPDFEPGQVQLTEAHKKRGVTQKVIDYINKHQKGVVLFPRTKAMIHNTVDKIADLAHQAQMPGFRLSKTGKFYYEGRSNRADRTRSGY